MPSMIEVLKMPLFRKLSKSAKGQYRITLPPDICKMLDWDEQDEIEIIADRNKDIILRKRG